MLVQRQSALVVLPLALVLVLLMQQGLAQAVHGVSVWATATAMVCVQPVAILLPLLLWELELVNEQEAMRVREQEDVVQHLWAGAESQEEQHQHYHCERRE